jgi:hypothetical protein
VDRYLEIVRDALLGPLALVLVLGCSGAADDTSEVSVGAGGVGGDASAEAAGGTSSSGGGAGDLAGGGGASSAGSAGDGGGPMCANTGEIAPPPIDPSDASNSSLVFVVDRWMYGDPMVTPEQTVTPYFSEGLDLDNRVGSEASPVCKTPHPLGTGMGITGKKESECGVDNAWGALLFDNNLFSTPSVSEITSHWTQEGNWSLLVQINGTGAPSVSGLSGAVYEATPAQSPPTFAESEVWNPTAESFIAGAPRVVISEGYGSNGTIVLKASALTIKERWPGYSNSTLQLPLVSVVLQLSISPDGKTADGIIAGLVRGQDARIAVREFFGAEHPNTCKFPTDWVAVYQDALVVPGESTSECDSISFGVGFRARQVILGSVSAPVTPAAPACN